MTPEAYLAWIDGLVTCITTDPDLDRAAAAFVEFAQQASQQLPPGGHIPRSVGKLLPYTVPLGNMLLMGKVPPDVAERVAAVMTRLEQQYPDLWAIWKQQRLARRAHGKEAE